MLVLDDLPPVPEVVLEDQMVCLLCGAVGTDFLMAHGKAVCSDCFTLLYRQSVERASRMQENRWIEGERMGHGGG